MSQINENHSVSVKLINGDEADVICDLMEELNNDLIIEDHGTYITIQREREELLFPIDEISEAMGRPYTVSNFLTVLATYKGYIEVNDDNVVIRDEG